jgi:CHAD domain-containing protein
MRADSSLPMPSEEVTPLPTEQPADAPPPKPKKSRRAKRLRLRSTDSMADAGRAIMTFHFARLRKLEAAASSADEDAIHDMRVAIRRVRAAFRIAGPYYKRKVARFFRSELRALADELGAARDLDVIINHAQAFVARQPAGAPSPAAYLAYLHARRDAAQQALLDHLHSKRLAKFNAEFEAFLSEPEAAATAGDGTAGPPRVCDVIPAAIWSQYSIVRAYETIDRPPIETLHALRIDFKRLRYLLEFFQGILGTSAARLIELTVQAQDHLGLLQDACVAAETVRTYVAENTTFGGSDLAAVGAYLTDLQNEIQSRREQFPELYREITGKPFRRQLARLLSNI